MLKPMISQLLSGRQGSALMVSTVAINVLSLGTSLYSIHLLNRYVALGLTPTLVSLTLGVLIAIAAEFELRKERQAVLTVQAARWDEQTSLRLFSAFTQSRYEALTNVPLPQRREALGAPMAMQQLGSSNNLAAVLDLPFALMFIAATALLYAPLGLVVLLACLLVLALGVLTERRQRALAEEQTLSNAKTAQLGQFLLAAGEVVRTLPIVGPLRRRWKLAQKGSLGSRRKTLDIQSHHQTLSQTVGQCLSVGVYAWGAVAAVQGTISTGALIGASILATRAFAVCSRAASLTDPLLRAQRAHGALCRIEQVETESASGVRPAMLHGRLELMDVAFAYPGQPLPLFERLSVDMQAGKVMVISGPNGTGKSSLIKLMLGLLTPERGLVRADGIELRQLAQMWWRERVGYAPQEPVFFDGTLRENLVLDRDVSEQEVIDLCREMGLETFLANDPAGLDRTIASHETGLAVGLRRRFAIIRAIIGSPQVVFLDEPTEGLDQAGQAAVAQLLNRLSAEGKTLVVASNETFIQRAADMLVDLSSKPVPRVGMPQAAPAPTEVQASHASQESQLGLRLTHE